LSLRRPRDGLVIPLGVPPASGAAKFPKDAPGINDLAAFIAVSKQRMREAIQKMDPGRPDARTGGDRAAPRSAPGAAMVSGRCPPGRHRRRYVRSVVAAAQGPPPPRRPTRARALQPWGHEAVPSPSSTVADRGVW
jgi:hypothetical protein